MINQRLIVSGHSTEQSINQTTNGSQTNSDKTQNSLLSWLASIVSLSEILRIMGASAIIASMSIFLLNGWSEGNDVTRYLKLLTQTALLTVTGFGMTFLLKENKGARMFFGLNLISVVANFTILGALIYSLIQLDGNLIQYPNFVTWKVIDTGQFSLISAAAVVFLTMVSKLSFSIFARQSSTVLTIGFLALSACLLIPVRSSIIISAMILVTALSAIYLINRLYQTDQQLTTPEGKFALATLLIPSVIMTVRAVGLYELDTVMSLSLASIGFIGLRQLLPKLSNSMLKDALDLVKGIMGLFIAFLMGDLLTQFYNSTWKILFTDNAQILFAFILVLLTHDTVKRSSSLMVKAILVTGSSLLLALMFASPILWNFDLTDVVCALAVGVALFFYANTHSSKPGMILGALTILSGVTMVIIKLIDLIELNSWITLGVCGALVIISASVIERYGVSLKLKLQQWTKK